MTELYAIKEGKDLLEKHNDKMQFLQSLVGVGEQAWDVQYRPLLNNFAEFVQQCPASEAHHHSGAGGILEHSVEVLMSAIEKMEHDLCNEQEQLPLQRYVVVSLALMHDVGKVMTDQVIHLFDDDKQLIGVWCPVLGKMSLIPNAAYYSIKFYPYRKYATHGYSASLLIQHILPTSRHCVSFSKS